jgi:hypothetical protein
METKTEECTLRQKALQAVIDEAAEAQRKSHGCCDKWNLYVYRNGTVEWVIGNVGVYADGLPQSVITVEQRGCDCWVFRRRGRY